jgi:methionyl-tRNA synthetase
MSDKPAKTYYVSTAIPYVNAKAHLGHALEFIQADTLARYHRGLGKEVRFVTGVDEHGTKIYQAAEEAGKKPQDFVDEISAGFLGMKDKLNLTYDHFVRTTSAEHKAACQALWKACAKDIYKDTYTGYYCVGCESYYTEKEVPGLVCPNHNKPLEKMSEENYFFKLSNYTEKLQELISSDKYKITPVSRKNEILGLIKQGLEDISISRSKDKLPWGVPVPGDENHVMWVWFDALPNYISALGYPSGKEFGEFWPADLHIVGKDILRFHAAIWPAMLLSAGEATPKELYVHGFIQTGGQKMSKSLGNVIDPLDVVDRYGIDAFRYYLLREIPHDADGDFTWERFDNVYNADLANELGNLVQRVAAMIGKYMGGEIGDAPAHSHDVQDFVEAMEALKFDRALEEIWEMVKGLNQYVEEEKPWALAKEENDGDRQHLEEVLRHLVSDLLQVAELIRPFMPETSEKIRKTFADGKVDTSVGILFPKIELDVEPVE